MTIDLYRNRSTLSGKSVNGQPIVSRTPSTILIPRLSLKGTGPDRETIWLQEREGQHPATVSVLLSLHFG